MMISGLGRGIQCARSLLFIEQLRRNCRFVSLRNDARKMLFQPTAAQSRPQGKDDSNYGLGRQFGQTRLATRVTTLPRRFDLYFAGNFSRQTIWAVISFGVGYYCANTVSLSFGALAINDVLAAAITVLFCEVVSKIYYAAPRATLKLVFLNSFKLGVIAALIADAFKLAG